MAPVLARTFKKWMAPPKLKAIRNQKGDQPVKILDVGCGNDSCEITRQWLNVDTYHGVDREFWQGQEEDYKKMDQLFLLDLDQSELSEVPDEFYDVVMFSHVIEHLENGHQTVRKLARKLRPGGLLYIETPSPRTLKYPSAIGFLNFYDDPTHKKVYPIAEIIEQASELKLVSSGTRRDPPRLIFLSPISLLLNLIYFLPVKRRIFATGLWDLLGVADFVLLKKPS